MCPLIRTENLIKEKRGNKSIYLQWYGMGWKIKENITWMKKKRKIGKWIGLEYNVKEGNDEIMQRVEK